VTVTVTLPGNGSHISLWCWLCMCAASINRGGTGGKVVGTHTKQTGVTGVTAAVGCHRPPPAADARRKNTALPLRDHGVILTRFKTETLFAIMESVAGFIPVNP
jgi:hypothetical protein